MKTTENFHPGREGCIIRHPWLIVVFVFLVAFLGSQSIVTAYEVIVDDSSVTASTGQYGFWMNTPGNWNDKNDNDANGNSYHRNRVNGNTIRNPGEVRWYPMLNQSGTYEVFIWYVQDDNNADNIPLKIQYNNAQNTFNTSIDQTRNGARWISLGSWAFQGTNNEYVGFTKPNENSRASADAVKFVLAAPVNHAPTANDVTETVNAGVMTTIPGIGGTDPDIGDTLTITSKTNPSHGTAIINGGATISYTPTGGYLGADSFTYTITDSGGLSDTATVTLTVANVHAPVAVADSISVPNGGTTTLLATGNTSVLANDTDSMGHPLTTILETDVQHGTLTLHNDGTFSYQHTENSSNSDSFSYKANDGTSNSNIVTVTITVTAAGAHAVSSATLADFTSSPLNMTDSVAPLVMIAASKDHQLFFKAYNDYADLDGDNVADTTYKPTIIYYGYFDSYKCYDYDSVNKVFEPKAVGGQDYSMEGTVTSFNSGQMVLNITFLDGTSGLGPFNNWTITNLSTGATGKSTTSNSLASGGNKTFTTTATDWISVGAQVRVSVSVGSYCTGANDAYWSGNFLNWISMSRIDTINKVLFGGHRRTDTATDTILERSYLPHDAHSWSKHYAGNDITQLTPFTAADFTLSDADPKNNGISFCNTTDVSGGITKSEEVTDPPLIKVAKGNYLLWAGNERWQCTWASGAPNDNHPASNGNNVANSGINANSSSPTYAMGIGQKNYVARVEACVSGLIGHEKCKQYPNGNYKPIGLLQAYGDDDQLKFGMVSGSYHKHVSGGTLIKNIRSFKDEVNWTTDGTFALVAPSAGGSHPGVTDNNADGIVNAWSLFRIVGYNHGDGTYLGAQYDNCPWGLSAFADVTGANVCKNWGNPFSEIYFQGIRYYSDAGVTGTYQDNTKVGIAGLPTPQNWDNPNPLGASNSCARASIIAFNSSTASYDNDELDANNAGVQEIWKSGRPGAGTSSAMTDVIGAGEGINGKMYFVGETNVDNQNDGEDQLCTPKTVNSLGDVGGLCPESPRLRGSYRIAGISYYAHTRDIRGEDLTGGRALTGMQTIDAYAVTNASSTPNIGIPHPITGGNAVKLLPACRNTSLSPAGNCAIVDFRIVNQVVNDGTGKGTGKFYVNWEDSEQGGDFDQDMWGTIEYEINGNTNTLKVITDVHAQSTGYKMGFGYVLNGTTKDGFHVHSGINNFSFNDSNAANIAGGTCAASCQDSNGASTATYTLGAATAELLKEPLWYAAKWGGFIDRNGDNTPDLPEEWDIEDTEGNPSPDGIPDNYFFAHNPQQLEDSLNRVFLKILQRTSSGTAAAVVSNNVRGEGALYQAYYEPQKKDSSGRTANWVGTVHGLWMDSYGLLREDNGDGLLGNYIDDPVVETYFDEAENRTRAKRWVSTEADQYVQDTPEIIELVNLKTLWNARKQLNFPTLSDNEIATQRSYDTSAANGRYIKTWIDANLDGIVDNSEFVDFAESSITASNYTFFDLNTQSEVHGLVKYIRGVETSGYRSRSVDYDGDGVTEVIRLGDIINSTPTMVAAPAEALDFLYRDSSYTTFYNKYRNRRNVLYVGANDGMLHAFNAGFFTTQVDYICSTDQSSYTTLDLCRASCPTNHCSKNETPSFSTNGKKSDGVTDATAHPLGSELWAYVPMNLQPHLKWLKDPNYTHVSYVDGKPRILDAKIFSDDSIHPEGWGTVLVIGTGYGGGAMTIDTGGDGLGGDANDKTRRSVYAIFDITDPESPPSLLAEIQPPDGSFTTVYPAFMNFKDKEANTPNKWFLVFGSGPTSLTTGENTGTAKLYLLDLDELTNPGQTISHPFECSITSSGSTMNIISCDTGLPNSFIGTPTVVDWDYDYKADVIYFGTVGGSSGNSGQLMRLTMDGNEAPIHWVGPETLIDVGQPVYAQPNVALDNSDFEIANKWIYFGTGRLLATDDKTSTYTQSLYGVKDAGSTINSNNLVDVTNVDVKIDGNLLWTPTSVTGQDVLNNLSFSSTIKSEEQSYFDVLEAEISQYACYDNNHELGKTPPIPAATYPSLYYDTATACDNDCIKGCGYRDGWKRDLPAIIVDATPATRILNSSALAAGILISTAYQPSSDACASEGESRLYGLYYKTGTALPGTGVFGSATDDTNLSYIDLGFGMATAPRIHTGTGSGKGKGTVFVQSSTGDLISLDINIGGTPPGEPPLPVWDPGGTGGDNDDSTYFGGAMKAWRER